MIAIESKGHHSVVRRVGGAVEVVRPLRDTSWWHRWKAEGACRKTLGHCWHVGGFVDWWCCACSAETDGMPAQECKICARLATEWGEAGS